MEVKRGKHTTIQDIADEANVSISTVSRVLNGTVPVHQDKQDAVLSAVARLDYRPNVFAQGLASGQSLTIGVLTQEISSPFYDEILHGILNRLRDTVYSPLVADGHWQAEKEYKAIEALLSRRVDGLIAISPINEDAYLQRVAAECPLVLFGRDIPSIYTINTKDFEGGYAATKHLIDLGHRRIAHIMGILSHEDAARRHDGYKQALQDAGLPIDDTLLVEGDFTEPSGMRAIETLLTSGQTFTALFASNDQMAYGARLALFRRGLSVPDDISIVGYDNQHGSAYTIPPLTTMRQPAGKIGELAADTILRLIKGEQVESVKLTADLIIRESTADLR